MALKFKKPDIKLQRLKILVYGQEGTGKSTLACTFPKTAYFDSEDIFSKPKYQKLILANDGAVISTCDIDEIIGQVTELMSTKHDHKAIVIDSLSVIYENLCTQAEKKVGTDFGRNVAEADKKIRHLINLLLRADMHIIVCCHAKKEYGDNMRLIGNTFVGYKRLGYMFDLVLETMVVGKSFFALVKKTRLEGFSTGEEINFNYQEIIRRCGKEAIEEQPNVIELASVEQIDEMQRLISLLKIPADIIDKWLTAAKAESFKEMSSADIGKCIISLQNKISNKEVK